MLSVNISYSVLSDDMVQQISSYLKSRLSSGWILGLILYNLYMADYPSCYRNRIAHLYADVLPLHAYYGRGLLSSSLIREKQMVFSQRFEFHFNKWILLHTSLPDLYSWHGLAATLL